MIITDITSLQQNQKVSSCFKTPSQPLALPSACLALDPPRSWSCRTLAAPHLVCHAHWPPHTLAVPPAVTSPGQWPVPRSPLPRNALNRPCTSAAPPLCSPFPTLIASCPLSTLPHVARHVPHPSRTSALFVAQSLYTLSVAKFVCYAFHPERPQPMYCDLPVVLSSAFILITAPSTLSAPPPPRSR